MSVKIPGVDVSKYQGNINWTAVKSSGIDFAFIRVGWCNYDGTITSGKDPFFEKNMKNAIAAGINVGVYVYSYAKTVDAAHICADNVARFLEPYKNKITMPVAFDIEDGSLYGNIGKGSATQIAKAFLSKIEELGYYPIIYTYTSFANSLLNMDELKDYDLWIADYRGYVGYEGDYSIWQYSSNGNIPGINGRVDVNHAYKNYPEIIKGSVENLSNLYYRVNIENKCQGFLSKDVNDVRMFGDSMYIPAGEYKIVSKENYPSNDGFYWCEIRLPDKSSCYAVYNMPDGRCDIIEKEDPVIPVDPIVPDKPEVEYATKKDIDELKEMISNLAHGCQLGFDATGKAFNGVNSALDSFIAWMRTF